MQNLLLRVFMFLCLVMAQGAYAVAEMDLEILKDLQQKQLEYSAAPDAEKFSKMLAVVGDVADAEQKLWAEISTLNVAAPHVSSKESLKLVEGLRISAEQLSGRQKQYFISALAHIALSLGDKGLNLAEKYLQNIKSAPHHAWIAHEHSLAVARVKYPEIFKNIAGKKPKEVTDYLAKKSKESLKKLDWKRAVTLAKSIDLSFQSKRDKLLAEIFEKAVEQDNFYQAISAIRGVSKTSTQGKNLLKWAEGFLENGELSNAARIAEIIDDGRYASDVWGKLTKEYAKLGYNKLTKNAAKEAIYTADNTRDEGRRYDALTLLAKRLAEAGLVMDAENALKLTLKNLREKKYIIAEEAIAEAKQKIEKQKRKETKQETPKEKPSLETLLKRDVKSDERKAKIAKKIVRLHAEIKKSTQLAQQIKNPILRAKTFREIAEIRAKQIDSYGILSEGAQKNEIVAGLNTGDITVNIVNKFSEDIAQNQQNEKSDKVRMKLPESGLGSSIPEVIHKHHLSYTSETVREIIPLSKDFTFKIAPYNAPMEGLKFIEGVGYSGYFEDQQEIIPKLIILEEGVATLADLYNWLKSKNINDYLVKKNGEYLLRRPIIVKNGASFIISASETKHLKLSKQAGSYIASSGKVFISDVELSGWDEDKNKAAIVDYKKKHHYRPFITFWSRGEAFIAASKFTALGYSNGKSYGISFSAGPKNLMKFGLDMPKRPTGIIVENSFDNMFYGFYSYEADDVALIGNEYIDNIVYGIDPHDRSDRLTIAYNTAYEAQEKHGIIISREVNDSVILGNISFNNKGSGFMLDRMSIRSLVYANTAFDNGQDGISLFESSCNILAANDVFTNDRSGIRVRNSQDVGLFANIIKENKQSAIHGYAATLEGDAAHVARDFELDKYGNSAALTLAGNHVENNGSGLFMENVSALAMKQDKLVNQSPKIIRGKWFGDADNNAVISDIGRKNGSFMMKKCPKGSWLEYACNFREAGYFDVDGQKNMRDRLNDENCVAAENENGG